VPTHGAMQLLDQRPRTRENVKLRTDFHLTSDGWVPDAYQLQSEYPFMMDMQGQAWTAHLLASADGTATAGELLEKLKAAGSLHPDTPPEEYARLLATMVSGGFLELL